ncbi:ABC-three component system middle component 5 [Microvirga lotononidis]|uniref:Uncharacterized protein n=1 Tax=Microvirga lotononidis TaxID=864069 RepID=I4YS85_9HYPH|nr:ABC-three component system middle component 5 [Microvirga lotononidis]EIM26827.1 hypothetical protein MicloDRAFT_00033770 [Microvirga lotononidis]WQO31386.1 ABC-three component system middle component 5 [Microvirga lotononidis]
MTYISYSAAQDPFHAVFRMLSLLKEPVPITYEVERVYIYDFYICFPWQIGKIEGVRSIPDFIRDRNALKRIYVQNEYEQIPEPRIMLQRMRPAQLAALNSLSSYGFLVPEHLKCGNVTRTDEPLPQSLEGKVNAFSEANRALFDFIKKKLSTLPLSGPNGLKAKTGLEEYRYDYVQT